MASKGKKKNANDMTADEVKDQRMVLLSKAMTDSAQHAVQRKDIVPPSIKLELFPCAGGFAEGFKRAGVTFDLSVEFMPNHCDSYQLNLGHRPVCMDVRDLLRMIHLGIFNRHVSMLVADPPCTPWSRSGKREGTEDERDMLEDTCEIIRLLRPDVYLIGNVPGLDDGPNLATVQRVIGGLSQHGYCSADFARLDAANYGVPQHRVRPFWFGHLAGACIQWPEPTHGDPAELRDQLTLPGVQQLLPWVTCGQALSHLKGDDLGRPVKLRKRNQNGQQHGSVAERPALGVGCSNLSDGNVLVPHAAYRDPVPTVERGTPVERGTVTLNGENHIMSRMDAPARTLTRNTHGDGCVILNDKHLPSSSDQPAKTVGAKDRGQSSVMTIKVNAKSGKPTMHPHSKEGEPAHTLTGSGRVHVLENAERSDSDKHRALSLDEPATTLRGGGEGHSAPEIIIVTPEVFSVEPHHPPSQHDEPAMTIRAGGGGGANRTMQLDGESPRRKGRKRDEGRVGQGMRTGSHDKPSATQTAKAARVGAGEHAVIDWPWEDRPSTVVQSDPRLAPPGHKDENYGVRSLPNAVVISEKAAAILQGFPEDWKFIGATKKERWSQVGQAMPPALAHAVATSVVKQVNATSVAVERSPKATRTR